ncbi:sigma-70 family rna polymerase sigma factor : RNA polymerase sigma factor, sigma-70 family OS=Singulisphaera acidiphila (strain ATCC BAA-1392 / DSM 18658 / VKM B-2454 / MOB10) GN=Sinac_6693 PE=4 SV=1: Sigma70_r4_2 [Gemmata massiliana]|uniref:RNA polymerase sigma factor 70 region 4 type 2 domain-containing protein n=1 Tax=Gemmata massiliana TaxID=1210884 RepID=A0A6P2CZR4_9BACT|nr:sigma-70 family RNA polymerase sigma factor [Gemmata massiliana]VTR94481.1 sigma-70 family rna polymerase sigma factor : RNA polymerase sigma factor, sigma-70 family OS=Singulisphaera acidiphila (strain ATCC BAA-1392 / DSM 18658 / VKM B-2454 / MOB10) GN=Sinac_6693 PE=4 SV=1: Sigma70_r4_2 [Gemmata massiliana]
MTDVSDNLLEPGLREAAAGDARAWRVLVERHHARLRRMAGLRLDPRLRGRVDPSDVLQEAYLDAARRLPEYLEAPPLPFFLWLRQLVGTRLAKAHRAHLGTAARDVRREARPEPAPAASSVALAEHLTAAGPRPSEAAARQELRDRLRAALDEMDPIDREVLALRHFEQLTNAEIARTLGLADGTASKRYVRALERLQDILAADPGLIDGWLT